MTIETRLAEIRARVDAATPGPWEWEGESDQEWPQGDNSLIARQGTGEAVLCAWGYDAYGITVDEADAEFIAASRTDLPALLAAVEAFKEKCDYIVNEFEDPVYESNGYALGVVAATRTLMDTFTTALEADANREDQTHD